MTQNASREDWGVGLFSGIGSSSCYLPEELRSEQPSDVPQLRVGARHIAWKNLLKPEFADCVSAVDVPRVPNAWRVLNTNDSNGCCEIYVNAAERKRKAAPIYTGNCSSLAGQGLSRTQARALAQAHELHPEFDWPPLWVPRQNHPLWLGVDDASGAPKPISNPLLEELLVNCTFGGRPMTVEDWWDYDGAQGLVAVHSDSERVQELAGKMQAGMNTESWMHKSECRKQPLAMLWDVRNASGARDVWTALDRVHGGAEVFLRDGAGAREQKNGKWDEIGWSQHACWQATEIWKALERVQTGCVDPLEEKRAAAKRDDKWYEVKLIEQKLKAIKDDARLNEDLALFKKWRDVDNINKDRLKEWECAIDVLHDYFGLKRLTPAQKRLRVLRVPIAEFNVADAELGRHLSAGERYVASVGRNQPASWKPGTPLGQVDEDAGFTGGLMETKDYGARCGEGATKERPFHSLAWWRWKWNGASRGGDQFVAGYASRFNYNASLAMGAGDPYGKVTFAAEARKTMTEYAKRAIARSEIEFGRQMQVAAGMAAQSVKDIEKYGINDSDKVGVRDVLAPGPVGPVEKDTNQRTFDQRTGSGGFYSTWFVPTGSKALDWAEDVRLFLRRDPNGDLYFPQHVDLQYLDKRRDGKEWTEQLFWLDMLRAAKAEEETPSGAPKKEALLLPEAVARLSAQQRRAEQKPRLRSGVVTGGAREQRYPPELTEVDRARVRANRGEERAKTLFRRLVSGLARLRIIPGSHDARGVVMTGQADAALVAVLPQRVQHNMVSGGAIQVVNGLRARFSRPDQLDWLQIEHGNLQQLMSKILRNLQGDIMPFLKRDGPGFDLENVSEQEWLALGVRLLGAMRGVARVTMAQGPIAVYSDKALLSNDRPPPLEFSSWTSGALGRPIGKPNNLNVKRGELTGTLIAQDDDDVAEREDYTDQAYPRPPENPVRINRDARHMGVGRWGTGALSAGIRAMMTMGERCCMLASNCDVHVPEPVVHTGDDPHGSLYEDEAVDGLQRLGDGTRRFAEEQLNDVAALVRAYLGNPANVPQAMFRELLGKLGGPQVAADMLQAQAAANGDAEPRQLIDRISTFGEFDDPTAGDLGGSS